MGNYEYAIVQNGKKTEAQLSSGDITKKDDFASSLFGRRSEKYFCKGTINLNLIIIKN